MKAVLLPGVILGLAGLPWIWCQSPVPIQFQSSPVQVATGSDAVFTIQTTTNVFSITWLAPGGFTLGQWISSGPVLNPLLQYQGRVTISATQLTISGSRFNDSGNYTATVTPGAATGLASNSLSVALNVFDAVGQVGMSVPSVAVEGSNVSLSCSWAKGTNTSVVWGKDGTSLPSDPHIIINGGSLIINPAKRTDAGQYSCTVRNPVSAQTAAGTLTIYYGPDTPLVNKSSSDCVGGGDATVGQTVQLTCTSVSLPAALISWQFNGQPLSAGQSASGTLPLQVFSTNQSGQYLCSAYNSITTTTSQQQLRLSVVGTCLSVGAVAGIVVACFVAVVLIIVAIVLIIHQRKVDRRLGTVITKQNLNNGSMVPAAPQNGHVNPAYPGDQSEPAVHSVNRSNRPKNQPTAAPHRHSDDRNPEMLTQYRAAHTSAMCWDSRLNHGTQLHNDEPVMSGLNAGPQNPESTRLGQQNPNILIQTGGGEAGAHTVLINLNTVSRQPNTSAQPQTVQVSLNAPPASGPSNQNQHANPAAVGMQFNDDSNPVQQNPPPDPSQTRTEDRRNPVRNTMRHRPQGSRDLGQPRGSQPHQHSDDMYPAYPASEEMSTRANYPQSRAANRPDTNTDPRQMPWDLLRGTPSYPNHGEDDTDSVDSQSSSSQDTERRNVPPSLRHRRSLSEGQVRNVSRASRRDVMRQLAQNAAQRRSRPGPNGAGQHADRLRWTPPPQSPTRQVEHVEVSHRMSVPQLQTAQTQTSEPNSTIGQRQAVPPNVDIPPVTPLTQAALQQHTIQTSNPLLQQIHQNQAALQNPATQPRPARDSPPKQLNRDGQVAPTPPPVLQPAEFRTLPKESLPKPQTLGPVPVMKRPVVPHHGHRPLHMPRHVRTMGPNLHRNPHLHAAAHLHGHVLIHPAHLHQVHRSRPRP